MMPQNWQLEEWRQKIQPNSIQAPQYDRQAMQNAYRQSMPPATEMAQARMPDLSMIPQPFQPQPSTLDRVKQWAHDDAVPALQRAGKWTTKMINKDYWPLW